MTKNTLFDIYIRLVLFLIVYIAIWLSYNLDRVQFFINPITTINPILIIFGPVYWILFKELFVSPVMLSEELRRQVDSKPHSDFATI